MPALFNDGFLPILIFNHFFCCFISFSPIFFHWICILIPFFCHFQPTCAAYWPQSVGASLAFDDSDQCHELSVTLLNETENPVYVTRSIKLSRRKKDPEDAQLEERTVTQFHFTNWPDFGVPNHPDEFLDFLFAVRQAGCFDVKPSQQECEPVVVHCTAGIGRTGTFVLVDVCLALVRPNHNQCPNLFSSFPLNSHLLSRWVFSFTLDVFFLPLEFISSLTLNVFLHFGCFLSAWLNDWLIDWTICWCVVRSWRCTGPWIFRQSCWSCARCAWALYRHTSSCDFATRPSCGGRSGLTFKRRRRVRRCITGLHRYKWYGHDRSTFCPFLFPSKTNHSRISFQMSKNFTFIFQKSPFLTSKMHTKEARWLETVTGNRTDQSVFFGTHSSPWDRPCFKSLPFLCTYWAFFGQFFLLPLTREWIVKLFHFLTDSNRSSSRFLSFLATVFVALYV